MNMGINENEAAVMRFKESLWHRGDEFKDVKYMRQYKWVIGNRENKQFAVGAILEVEDGGIDLLDESGGCVMVLREEDTWAWVEDILK